MLNVKRSAAILAYATLALMSALIMAALVLLLMPELSTAILIDAAPSRDIQSPPTLQVIYGLQAAGWVFLGLNLFLLWHIYSLFCLYALGEALSPPCGHHLCRIGLGLMLLPAAATFYGLVSSVLLSWANGPGARELTLAIDLQSLGFVVGGALLMFVGTTMRHAADIAEDHRGFI